MYGESAMPAETIFGVCRGGAATGNVMESVLTAPGKAPLENRGVIRHESVGGTGNSPGGGTGSTVSKKTSFVEFRRLGSTPVSATALTVCGMRREPTVANGSPGRF